MSSSEFEGQHDGERVLFVFRCHAITMRKGFYGLLLGLLAGGLLGYGFAAVNHDAIGVLWGLLIGLVVGGLYLLYQWMKWHFSIFIVTNERIRRHDQRGLFTKSVIDLNLDNIKNISYNVPGFTAEIFGFGTLVLQTAVGDLVVHRVERVGKVYNGLSDAVRNAGGELHTTTPIIDNDIDAATNKRRVKNDE